MNTDLTEYASTITLSSGSQIARVVTEAWASDNLYCPGCNSNSLTQARVNTPAVDFDCPECLMRFQLKSRRGWDSSRVVDAAYDKMIAAIRSDTTPNLLVLGYSRCWHVERLLLVPWFFFSESAIEKRRPLGPNARRAGWVGCNILLGSIPNRGKISMIDQGIPTDRSQVRSRFAHLSPLRDITSSVRGWTLDVLTTAELIGSREFTLSEIYALEPKLAALHPNNKHVRAKIRQQLQVLRDLGLIQFMGSGRYRFTDDRVAVDYV